MFLVDKYKNDSNYIVMHNDIIERLLNTFDSHQEIYMKANQIVKKKNDFKKIIKELETGNWRYSNLQHMILYGEVDSGKEYIIESLLKKIYGCIEIKNTEYIINGYSNNKEKVTIRQSKYHIIIEPNNNGFDKYLVQEIIQDYAKTINLQVFKYKKQFKIVLINKIDNLSYSAQAALRRTMEKYADICKFVFICDQLSKVLEPIRSRCLLVRIPLPTDSQIIDVITHISHRENICLDIKDYKYILDNCESRITNAIWLLNMKQLKIDNDNSWLDNIELITNKIFSVDDNTCIISLINELRERFYILFITNIDINKIIIALLEKIIERIKKIEIKYKIIDIISKYENRITIGTRYIVHLEAMIFDIINIIHNKNY